MTVQPRLVTERLVLTPLGPDDARRMLDYHVRNLDHLAPWHPPMAADFLTEAFWARRLAQWAPDQDDERALRLAMLGRDDPDGPVLGTIAFTQWARGPFQACTLGYSLDRAQQGRGLMHEGLRAAIDHVFGARRMHRIQANYIPTNERSGRVLRGLGFVVEGYARDYLFIDGAWRDHVLTALTHPAPFAPDP